MPIEKSVREQKVIEMPGPVISSRSGPPLMANSLDAGLLYRADAQHAGVMLLYSYLPLIHCSAQSDGLLWPEPGSTFLSSESPHFLLLGKGPDSWTPSFDNHEVRLIIGAHQIFCNKVQIQVRTQKRSSSLHPYRRTQDGPEINCLIIPGLLEGKVHCVSINQPDIGIDILKATKKRSYVETCRSLIYQVAQPL